MNKTKLVEFRKPETDVEFPVYVVHTLDNGVIVDRLAQSFNTQTEAFAYAESLSIPYSQGSLRP